ncbi:MAG: hypothetical protein ABI690_26720 [Chloroflexota bacterium]
MGYNQSILSGNAQVTLSAIDNVGCFGLYWQHFAAGIRGLLVGSIRE